MNLADNHSAPLHSEVDIVPLITLQPLANSQGVGTVLDCNQNGRVFGGQILAQVMAAATQGAPDRHATALQLLFLQGALPGLPIHYTAQALQNGRRFTSIEVRAQQADRVIAQAHVSLQSDASGFEHQSEMPHGIPPPEQLRNLEELAAYIATQAPGHRNVLPSKPVLDLRLVDPDRYILQPSPTPRLRYWVRVRQRLADRPALHAAALAYVSDYWLGYATMCSHTALVTDTPSPYMSSLNHALWLHRPCRADEWLLFDVESPCATRSRGLNNARVYTRDGCLVASVAQEFIAWPREA
jgi:acyl-CoA thioesterase II